MKSQDPPPPPRGLSVAPGIPSHALRDTLTIAALWFASLLVVWPSGNFPLNDDWAFARSVKHLLETGKYYPTPWAAMPLLTQTFWGALFCLPAGFSFQALRCSTLVMALSGVLATYFALRQVHPSRLVAVLGSLTIAFNPIYFALSNTFMTDVPFAALMMGSALFFLRNLRNGSRVDLIAGTLLALAATLSRELSLAVPLGFALCSIWQRGLRRGSWARAIAPPVLCVAGLVAYQTCMRAAHLLPTSAVKVSFRLHSVLSNVDMLLPALRKNSEIALLYLGWFALPISVLFLPTLRSSRGGLIRFLPAFCVGTVFAVFSVAAQIRLQAMMPTLGNILVVQGIGPLTLSDAHAVEPEYLPSIGKSFWLAITTLSVLGGSFLVAGATAALPRAWRSLRLSPLPADKAGSVLFLVSLVAYLFPILALGGWDRYFVPALPLLLVGAAALVAQQSPRQSLDPGRSSTSHHPISTLISVGLLGFMILYSVCGTRDYFNWNRARWRALEDLMISNRATPEDVDGGFEFNGWYLYDPNFKSPKGNNWWWVHRNEFVVTFGPQAGYVVLREYAYAKWLPPGQGRILVLSKQAGTPSSPP